MHKCEHFVIRYMRARDVYSRPVRYPFRSTLFSHFFGSGRPVLAPSVPLVIQPVLRIGHGLEKGPLQKLINFPHGTSPPTRACPLCISRAGLLCASSANCHHSFWFCIFALIAHLFLSFNPENEDNLVCLPVGGSPQKSAIVRSAKSFCPTINRHPFLNMRTSSSLHCQL